LRNGTTVQPSQIWASGSPISWDIDGLDVGVYNYTLIVQDTSGNILSWTTFVLVSDLDNPVFTATPGNYSYFEEDTGNFLSWTMFDNYPGTYELFRNGTPIPPSGNWNSFVSRQFNIDNLSTGKYNYTLSIYDLWGNHNSSTVFVSVYDNIAPIFTNVPTDTVVIIEGTSNNILSWIGEDTHPGRYNITIGDNSTIQPSWVSNQLVTINIDYLLYGIYNVTITIFDESNNYNNYSLIVIVEDHTLPNLIVEPEEGLVFIMDTKGNYLSWTASDLNPESYVVYIDDQVLTSKLWEDSIPILVSVDGYDASFYNFTIVIFDQGQNSVSHSVIIRVKDPEIIDTTRPIIDLQEIVYEGDVDTITGNWTTTTGDPIQDATILVILTHNLQQQAVYQFTTLADGTYILLFNYTDLLPGDYDWEISFQKEGYQAWNDLADSVTIVPHNYQIILDVPPNLVKGEEFFISVTILYNNNNSNNNPATLSLSEVQGRSGAVEGVRVNFEITLLYEDNAIKQVRTFAVSNKNGIALTSLSALDTIGLQSIESITTSIGITEVNTPISVDHQVPTLTITVGEPELIDQILDFIEQNVVLIPIILSLPFAAVFVFAYFNKKKQERITQINNSVKLATSELRAIESIQSIIIQTSTKLTVYEEQIQSGSMDTSLVGGMVTAFSSFLNEIGSSELFGFEMMEREGVSVTAHKGEKSNFILITNEKLPLVTLSQIQDTQKIIEDDFKSYFTDTSRGARQLSKEQISTSFEKGSFKVALRGDLILSEKNIPKLMREQSFSRVLKQNIKLLDELPNSEFSENNKFTLENIFEFFRSKGISKQIGSRAIILAYQYKILEPHTEEYVIQEVAETEPEGDLLYQFYLRNL
jgi:hypothetical protein